MYYLSRVQIDVNNRQKTKSLTHLGAFHNWVEQSFPDELEAGERSRHLWRIDTLAGKKYLLILSPDKPDIQHLLKYGVLGTAEIKSYDNFLAHIQEGQIMRFRLTANPTHSVTKPGEKKKRVFPHITVAQQQKWLEDRAEKSGFKLLDSTSTEAEKSFDIVNRSWQLLRRENGHRVRLSSVTFEGLLQVEDVTRFRQVLVNGIGREKAFGMGLMTVIPEG